MRVWLCWYYVVILNIYEAVLKLRTSTGESQQAFATRLGIAIRSLANYEKDKVPPGRLLVKLLGVADENGLSDCAEIIRSQLVEKLEMEFSLRPSAKSNRALTAAHAAAMRLSGKKITRDEILSIQADIIANIELASTALYWEFEDAKDEAREEQ
jgi:transcriptional regulator with XRE-family HTH domain